MAQLKTLILDLPDFPKHQAKVEYRYIANAIAYSLRRSHLSLAISRLASIAAARGWLSRHQGIKLCFTLLKYIIHRSKKRFKQFQDFIKKDIIDFRDFSKREVQDSIQRVRQEAETQIPHLVETEVARLVKDEVASLERTLRREGVIGQTIVDYFLPNGINEPHELKLLESRKFRRVRFRTTIESIKKSPGNVIILDLKNWVMPTAQKFSDLSEAEQQSPGKEKIQDLLEILSESVVIIVYISGRLFYLNEIKDRYVIAANNSITLVGNAADGAYVAAGDRRSEFS